jgi:hypothetical protein
VWAELHHLPDSEAEGHLHFQLQGNARDLKPTVSIVAFTSVPGVRQLRSCVAMDVRRATAGPRWCSIPRTTTALPIQSRRSERSASCSVAPENYFVVGCVTEAPSPPRCWRWPNGFMVPRSRVRCSKCLEVDAVRWPRTPWARCKRWLKIVWLPNHPTMFVSTGSLQRIHFPSATSIPKLFRWLYCLHDTVEVRMTLNRPSFAKQRVPIAILIFTQKGRGCVISVMGRPRKRAYSHLLY